MNKNTIEYTPNVRLVRDQGVRIIRGSYPRAVRNEWMAAVKSGFLGRLKQDGLKPEVFYHPNHELEAIESQLNAALYAIECIRKVCV